MNIFITENDVSDAAVSVCAEIDSGVTVKSFVWNVDGSGFYDTTTTGFISIPFDSSGLKLVKVIAVTDSNNVSDTASIAIHFPEAGNTAPYFEYAKFLHENKDYSTALDYCEKCMQVFKDVVGKLKNKSYKRSYLNRPDRKEAMAYIKEKFKIKLKSY